MPNLRFPQINSVTVSGRLTRDPELRYIPSGTPVCELGIATDNGFGDKKKTSFLGVVCWEKTAERAAELRKGAAVIVEGRIESDQWEKDGKKHSKTKITAHRVHALEWPDDDRGKPAGGYDAPIPDDDIPF